MKNRPHPAPQVRSARRQRGLSVVELMVGLTIGMLLVAGLALMFSNATRSSVELEKTVRHIENGRKAIDLLSEDIALAGFYGTVPVTTYAAGLSPCADGTAVATDLAAKALASPLTIPFPVEGIFPSQAAYGADANGLSCLANRKSGTPALVLRRLDTTLTAAGGTLRPNAAYVQTSHSAADNFYSYKAASNGTGFTLRDGAGATNGIRRFITRAYYIATCSDCSGSGDGIPTLTRLEIIGTQTFISPLAEGIEQIGFDYGFDTNADGIPDAWYGLNDQAGSSEYATAAGKGWGNVVALRIAVISRNTTPTTGQNDTNTYLVGRQGDVEKTIALPAGSAAYKHRSLVATVRLQTVAGLREKP